MIYIKFSDKDTDTMIKNLSKVVNFRTGSSMLVASVDPDFKEFCKEILEFIEENRIVPFEVSILRAIKQVVFQFSVLSFGLPNRLKELYAGSIHYQNIANCCRVYSYFEGDKVVLNDDIR